MIFYFNWINVRHYQSVPIASQFMLIDNIPDKLPKCSSILILINLIEVCRNGDKHDRP